MSGAKQRARIRLGAIAAQRSAQRTGSGERSNARSMITAKRHATAHMANGGKDGSAQRQRNFMTARSAGDSGSAAMRSGCSPWQRMAIAAEVQVVPASREAIVACDDRCGWRAELWRSASAAAVGWFGVASDWRSGTAAAQSAAETASRAVVTRVDQRKCEGKELSGRRSDSATVECQTAGNAQNRSQS